MNVDPLSIALKEVSQTQALVESLLISSEAFNYPKARSALRQLQRKVKRLERVRRDFEHLLESRAPNIHVVDFRAAVGRNAHK